MADVTLTLRDRDGRQPYGKDSSLSVVAGAFIYYHGYLEKRIAAIEKRMARSVVPNGHGRSWNAKQDAENELRQLRRVMREVLPPDEMPDGA